MSWRSVIVLIVTGVLHLSSRRIQNQALVPRVLVRKIEQREQRAGDGIGRLITDCSEPPVIFNELQNGCLVGYTNGQRSSYGRRAR